MVIEANRMFDFDIKKYKVLIHPQSYVHTIIKFKNGLIKMLLHDTDMKIPIFNSIYHQKLKHISSKKINSKTLNNLKFYDNSKCNVTRQKRRYLTYILKFLCVKT